MKQEQAGMEAKKRRPVRVLSAREKSQAVLALWSGRRNSSALAKELGVSWGMINSWEQRALSGMLSALDPAWTQATDRAMELPVRLEKLIAQMVQPSATKETAATT